MPTAAYPDIAKMYLTSQHEAQYPGGLRLPTLRWLQGSLYVYDKDHYVELEPEVYKSQLTIWLASKNYNTLKDYREVDSHVKAALVAASPRSLHSWASAARTGRWLAFRNGILNLTRLLKDGTVELLAHSPDWVSTTVMPYDFNQEAQCPTWMRCLSDWFPQEKDTQSLVQEMSGYILWTELPFHGGFFLEGTGSNGKSTYINTMQKMVGPSNYSCLALEEFSRNFALNATVDKLVNFASEMDPGAKLPIGTLKRFTGSDELTIDRKYQKQITFRATAKLIVAWNERPVIKDTSDGFWRRMRIIPFRQKFVEGAGADIDLESKLAQELPGILNWAVAGLRRLMAAKAFTVSASGFAANANFRDQSDPIRAYLLEFWEMGEGDPIPKNLIYQHYVDNRIDPEAEPLLEGKFFKELYRCLPGVVAGRVRGSVAGTRVPTISGIRPKKEHSSD